MLDRHDQASLVAAVADADALLVRTYAKVSQAVIAAAAKTGRLKVIGRAGVGVDNIDVAAARSVGIVVVNTPAASTDAVAELVVGLVVAVQRGFVLLDARVRKGEFAALCAGTPKATELQHQTLGVIGMGRIGRAVGRRLHNGMGTQVIYYDIREIGWLPFAARSCGSAEEVYAQADVVTLHVPLTALTRGMIDATTLASFKPGADLINASRGPVVEARGAGRGTSRRPAGRSGRGRIRSRAAAARSPAHDRPQLHLDAAHWRAHAGRPRGHERRCGRRHPRSGGRTADVSGRTRGDPAGPLKPMPIGSGM